ncbi:cation:proton antiporter [Herminiimonas sp. CN]|uniref:cation:proton antiporter n=1 Tax=Herminiimonas sp. CN TaxID=1349818 RepID=UPI000473E7D0|nr:cation:proton antiporter [Herminiimonas sp. CN]
MSPFSFLPDLPGNLNVLTALGLVLIAGIFGARLVRHVAPVPAITGYVLTGLLIGPAGLNLIGAATLNGLDRIVELALGLFVFELGRRLDYRWLLKERWLLITGLAVSIGVFAALFGLLLGFGLDALSAALAAAIGTASSPAATLNVVQEVKAEGQVSARMLNIVVINNSLAFLLFIVCLSVLHWRYGASWSVALLHPLYLIVGSIVFGLLAGRLLVFASRHLEPQSHVQHIMVFALVAATVGIADMFKFPALVSLLVFAVSSRYRDGRQVIVESEFSQINSLLYVILFVFAGARLELAQLGQFWLIGLAYIAVRLAVMAGLGTLLAPWNGLQARQGALLGLGLLPMSGVAILTAQYVSGIHPEFGAQLSALVLSVVAVLEIIGPISTHYALLASGESNVHKS